MIFTRVSRWGAESVQDYLVNQAGLDEAVFAVVGYGESRPVVDNTTPEGRRKNRRFEIVVEK